MKSLYEVTGNVCDINTMLINKAELDGNLKQCRDAALDEAAKVCDELKNESDDLCEYAAHIIRGLK